MKHKTKYQPLPDDGLVRVRLQGGGIGAVTPEQLRKICVMRMETFDRLSVRERWLETQFGDKRRRKLFGCLGDKSTVSFEQFASLRLEELL